MGKELEVSFYESFSGKGRSVDLMDVLKTIKNGGFSEYVEKLRSMKGDDERYDEYKKKLPHFTPSGLFGDCRRIEHLVSYNPAIMLDLDHVGYDNAVITRDLAAAIEFTVAAFISPGGEGVKILVKTDSTVENHIEAFNCVSGYYEKRLRVPVDRSGRDISRACFVSWDSEAYLNEAASVFKVNEHSAGESKQLSVNIDRIPVVRNNMDNESLFRKAVEFAERNDFYMHGNRNSFVYKLLCNLNKKGMDRNVAEKLIRDKYKDLTYAEIGRIVYNAYKNTDEHGIYGQDGHVSASFDGIATPAPGQSERSTPFIPYEVYDHLPETLGRLAWGWFHEDRERDVFLTGALSIFSGCFSNVTGFYDRMEYSPNLYSFIIAPPASGKGVLNHARRLACKIHESLINGYDSDEKGNDGKMRTHYIPADSSSAAIKRVLKLNGGHGTICETEADTLSATLAQDWGGFDDLLRKAFQHEPISCSRIDNANDGQYDVKISEVSNPKLSICLSGTPSQVPALLKSSENGLFSRFIFYTFRNDGTPLFKDVFGDDPDRNFGEFLGGVAYLVYDMYIEALKAGPTLFELTVNQQKQFRLQFNKTLQRLNESHGADTHGIVFRLGLITFRIAMVLSILRRFEEKSSGKIICSDEDFRTSMILSDIYLQHSLSVYQTLPGSGSAYHSNAMTLLHYLPTDGFSYSDAVKIAADECGFGSRSVSTYLKKLKDKGLLKQPKFNGLYYKV